jgi:hypothetical protein
MVYTPMSNAAVGSNGSNGMNAVLSGAKVSSNGVKVA